MPAGVWKELKGSPQTIPSAIAPCAPRIHAIIACGPASVRGKSEFAKDGSTPTIIPVFRLAASRMVQCRGGIIVTMGFDQLARIARVSWDASTIK